jgi:prefoldin subunit 5
MTRDQELEMLRQQAQGFAGALDEIRRRIDELEAQGESK